MQETGSYDRLAIEWGHTQGRPCSSAQENQKRDWTRSSKERWAKGSAEELERPRWNYYDDGPDPVTWLKEVLPVRDALLAHYSSRMLRPGEPNSISLRGFPSVYLFHRYALGAAINVVGSAKIPLSLAGDGQQPVIIWPAESQKEALQLAVGALNPAQLDVPPDVWKALVPVENRDSDPNSLLRQRISVQSAGWGARGG